jgi:hypothetical protein
MKTAFFLLWLLISNAHAYKMTIYTDQPDKDSADKVISTFKKTYPFNQFQIDFEVRLLKPEELKCAPLYGISRLLGCDTLNIARESAMKGVDQAMIIKHTPVYGGSGGAIPVMSSSSPPSTLVHEYLHTLGLCDEYEYAVTEADKYCMSGGPNMAMIAPDPKGYPSDADARSKHMGQIPWASLIKSTTKISRPPFLGTGSVNHSALSSSNSSNEPNKMNSAIGLYEGKTCKNALISHRVSWQPGQEATIMEYLEAGLGAANEQIVAKILDAKGVKRKTAETRSNPAVVDSRATVDKSDKGADKNSSYSGTAER